MNNTVEEHISKVYRNNYTSIYESEKLLKLGLSPNSADMCYADLDFPSPLTVLGMSVFGAELEGYCCVQPCWSVGALFELINEDKENPFVIKHEDNMYYIDCHEYSVGWYLHFFDAVYNMVILLLTNNKIKKV